jgi:hypothetical protein
VLFFVPLIEVLLYLVDGGIVIIVGVIGVMDTQQQGVIHHMHLLQECHIRLDLPHQLLVELIFQLQPEVDIQVLQRDVISW